MSQKMTVEIWSDIMCPFCYIGKRKFEHALAEFPNKENIEIVWKSFQLSPDLKPMPGKNINQYLSEHKGIPLAHAEQMNKQVTAMAQQVGLTYNFDKSVIANSFDAHRFSHLALQHGVQDAAEEKLFSAYFTEGKDMSDHDVLVEIGREIGLDETLVRATLSSKQYAEAVHHDIEEAEQIGVRGVPFFVFDRQYAVSGAQDTSVFTSTLERAFQDWEKK